MQKARLKRLLHQYFNNSISGADCIELLEYLNAANPGELDELIDYELSALDEGPDFKGQQSQDVLDRIKSDLRFTSVPAEETEEEQPEVIRFYQRRWVQVAAAVLICCAAGLIILKNQKPQESKIELARLIKPDVIVPGSNKAILTVSGGKTIVLDSAANGVIAKTNAGRVIKTSNGKIIYKGTAMGAEAAAEVGYNTLSTPRGGNYQVTLPDGTKVWLDAASSITYPTAFTGGDRKVKLTGQAYFEVAKNPQKPFYVDANNVEVKVLGTHFNISAYNDDAENTTTLLEGSVQISKNNSTALLKPGQQAIIPNNSNSIKVADANINDVMAWKNGYFIFDDDNITGIMRKVSRWYDVEVEYQGNFDDQHFGGTFYKTKGINELLGHFEKVGKLHFKVTGRRITVMD